jgi:excisionase family DNA binding protein
MDIITAREAARLLRCHVSAVYSWGEAGFIAAWRVGSKWEFDRSSVEAFRRAAKGEWKPTVTRRQRKRQTRDSQRELAARGYD